MLDPKQQVLLMFLSQGAQKPVDPIRIMKGLFLIVMATPEEWLPQSSRYQFVPYDYGPCSFEIYGDLDKLEREGYIDSHAIPGKNWKYYKPTATGITYGADLAKRSPEQFLSYVIRVKDWVLKQSLRALLENVYRAYPEFAVNSVFQF